MPKLSGGLTATVIIGSGRPSFAVEKKCKGKKCTFYWPFGARAEHRHSALPEFSSSGAILKPRDLRLAFSPKARNDTALAGTAQRELEMWGDVLGLWAAGDPEQQQQIEEWAGKVKENWDFDAKYAEAQNTKSPGEFRMPVTQLLVSRC